MCRLILYLAKAHHQLTVIRQGRAIRQKLPRMSLGLMKEERWWTPVVCSAYWELGVQSLWPKMEDVVVNLAWLMITLKFKKSCLLCGRVGALSKCQGLLWSVWYTTWFPASSGMWWRKRLGSTRLLFLS